jgi:hypothetical protein
MLYHGCGEMARKPVILSEAKDLGRQILRFAQDDKLTGDSVKNPGYRMTGAVIGSIALLPQRGRLYARLVIRLMEDRHVRDHHRSARRPRL